MKILALTSSYPLDKINTDGFFIHEFLRELKKNSSDEIFVLCPHKEGALTQESKDEISIFRFHYFFPYCKQILAYDEGLPYKFFTDHLAKVQLLLFILSELFFSINLIKKHKIDLINSHWLVPQGFVGAINKKIFKIPHIVTLHSSEITFLRKIPGSKLLVSFIIQNSDVIVSVSKHRAIELVNFFPLKEQESIEKKIRIIPMGLDFSIINKKYLRTELREKYTVSSKFVILFIGRLVEVKGCLYLLEAIKKLSENQKKIQVRVIGSGPLENELKNYVVENNLQEIISFEGFIEHDRIGEFLAISDVFVFPSIVDSYGYEEGLPVSVLEALANGLPVIASTTKGIREVIHNGENGVLVLPESSEMIADAIISLQNIPYYQKISQNAYKSGLEYSWKNIVHNYDLIIREITEHD